MRHVPVRGVVRTTLVAEVGQTIRRRGGGEWIVGDAGMRTLEPPREELEAISVRRIGAVRRSRLSESDVVARQVRCVRPVSFALLARVVGSTAVDIVRVLGVEVLLELFGLIKVELLVGLEGE